MADEQERKPKTPAKTSEEAGRPPQRGAWGQFLEGFDQPERDIGQTRLEALISNSAFNPKGYGRLASGEYTPQAKAAYVAGRLAHDVLTDGSRVPYWALNHPLAITGVLGEEASAHAGLSPDYGQLQRELEARNESASKEAIDQEFSKRMGFYHSGQGSGAPLTAAKYMIPALATGALTQLSGNTNYLNLLGGGRPAGYAAVLPSEEDRTVSNNPVLELAARYVLGRTGRLLPWEEFTAERPDVSYDDYRAAATHQFDKGVLGVGLLRGTTRNLEGEPEATLMGFRVPFSSGTAALGAMVGGVAGAQALEPMIEQQLAKRHQLFQSLGHRRMAGAAIGALAGAVGGKLGGMGLNAAVIQPVLNPERVAQAQAWNAMTPEERSTYVLQRQKEIEGWKQQQAVESGLV